ncbi:MAG: hypothetical protein JO021_20905 [Alphaproteobacteria bacterium]|nr:hypothetical protein [Alphaproteobacteria bacterium]
MNPKDLEAWRREFDAMLDQAVAEAEREGRIPLEVVLAEMDEIIRGSRES